MSSTDRKIPAILQSKRDLSEGLAIFRFSLTEEFHFNPGQHATLWLTHHGNTIPRPYSIASSPSETRVLEFYINLVEQGRLTRSMWDSEVLRGLLDRDPHTHLAVTGPKGRFVLDPADHRDLVLVASGTGLAPFMSMIRKMNEDYLSAPEGFRPRNIYVLHGASYSSNLGYHDELEKLASESMLDSRRRLAVVYLPTISRPHLDPSWTGLRGRVEMLFDARFPDQSNSAGLQSMVQRMLGALVRPETHAVYICGHPGTVDNVERLLCLRGFKPGLDLKREKYYK